MRTVFGAALALALLALPQSAGAAYLIGTSDSLMANSADYLVITHDSLTDALYPLCRLRESLGLEVKMAELGLIYLTFDSGPRPERIKAFLQQAFDHWSVRPEFVLLAGDACRDSARGDLLPSKVFPKFSYPYAGGLTDHCSDNWYGTLAGADSVPDVMIGRLPVQTLAQAEAGVAKIVRYETAPDTGLWSRTSLLLASSDFQFMATNADTLFLRPAGESVYTIYENQGSSAFLRHKTILGFNLGAHLVVQFTHGAQPPAWTGSRTLFSYLDADSLTNAAALPVVLGRG
jgi:hypothetical protein